MDSFHTHYSVTPFLFSFWTFLFTNVFSPHFFLQDWAAMNAFQQFQLITFIKTHFNVTWTNVVYICVEKRKSPQNHSAVKKSNVLNLWRNALFSSLFCATCCVITWILAIICLLIIKISWNNEFYSLIDYCFRSFDCYSIIQTD